MKLKLNPLYSVEKSAVFVSSRPVDSLRFEKIPAQSDGEEDSFRYISDVALLLNAERLINVLGPDNYNKMLSSKKTSSPYLADSKRYTDSQLFSAIKPRTVQSNSEVRAWTDLLTAQVLKLEDAARQDVQQRIQKEIDTAVRKQQNTQQQQQLKTE